MLLKNKTIILGVSGGIAAYKSASLASLLMNQGAEVHVIMTKNAAHFITPTTFETLTGHKCLTDTFDRSFEFHVEHIALAKRADAFVVAPATANTLARLAHGLADDMLTTTYLACRAPKILVPSMNTAMYENPVTQNNIAALTQYGAAIIPPESGRLACGDTGSGKMPEPEVIAEHVAFHCAFDKDLSGLSVLVTAGPTRESIDPVRYITNHSSGKMGFEIARICAFRGAAVTLVSGPVSLMTPVHVNRIDITSSRDMFDSVTAEAPRMDIIIKAAAVADFTPASVSPHKMKKQAQKVPEIPLKKTEDILGYLGDHKTKGQFLCGFSMETENLVANSRKKLESKNLDIIVANCLFDKGAGFQCDTNIVTFITGDQVIPLEIMTKEEVASLLVDHIMKMRCPQA